MPHRRVVAGLHRSAEKASGVVATPRSESTGHASPYCEAIGLCDGASPPMCTDLHSLQRVQLTQALVSHHASPMRDDSDKALFAPPGSSGWGDFLWFWAPTLAQPGNPAAYLPSRSESPGIARSTLSLSRCQASRVACFARSHSSEDVPRAVFQSRFSSGSTSSNERSG